MEPEHASSHCHSADYCSALNQDCILLHSTLAPQKCSVSDSGPGLYMLQTRDVSSNSAKLDQDSNLLSLPTLKKKKKILLCALFQICLLCLPFSAWNLNHLWPVFAPPLYCTLGKIMLQPPRTTRNAEKVSAITFVITFYDYKSLSNSLALFVLAQVKLLWHFSGPELTLHKEYCHIPCVYWSQFLNISVAA